MMKVRTALAQLASAGALMAFAGCAAAQPAYPSKPIRLIVPYAPGGSTDPQARMIAKKLADKWGQPVVVDNRGGGNTIIGTEAAAKSPPDGYTILWIAPSFITTPSLLSLPYDNVKDFAPVATISKSRNVLVLNPSVPANNLQELIALAKSKPGQLNYGSSGVGTAPHLDGERFSQLAGVKMQHIPYKGSGPLIPDLISGQVQLSFQGIITVLSHIRSGKLKAIAVGGDTRFPGLPQVPTFAEAGLPAFGRQNSWHGIVAPAGTPRAIIDKMSREIADILSMPDVQEFLAKQGVEPFYSPPSEAAALVKTEIARMARIVKAANIRIAK